MFTSIAIYEASKQKIEFQESYIKALDELKVVNGLAHNQHEEINSILKNNNLDKKYYFVFNKSKGKAYIRNLENNTGYFFSDLSSYSEIIITDEIIEKANYKLEVLKEVHELIGNITFSYNQK